MRGLFIIIVFSSLFSCSKDEDQLSEVPSLELISIGPNSVVQFEDSVVIRLAYEDGDGDLGGFPADSVNLFVVDNRNGVPFEFRIQELVPGGAEVPIKGTLSITLQNLFLTGNGSQENATFNIYAYDRAGNKSNVVKTPGVTVLE
ncbi:hypothetical protein Oweho_3342 [Owenweeksia hongkongensis DSM 17368]|uniref:Uncharacterized protein n=1 Tax=Owenweeksia hongkongensis (strain DSM 17368 / CIP 108786 / JCM 12287 / NRRL B-23963 / UST20020801) TaxID=926562 RepID=G8R4X9_OWEHD|nr:hypothetical protein [Owenweeksia hongkongensis]AEV34293.1 hypothetical protein Oweho_3342 [Owenweeksia hongkongensis DSM 17368]